MKKVIAVLTTVLMTFVMLFDNYSISQFVLADSGLGSIIASGECGANGDNLTWTLDDEGLLVVSGKGEMENYKKLGSPLTQDTNAPWHSYNNSIQTIIVDNGVTSIGDWAFAFCFKLKSASIFNDVTRIGEYAFNGCYNLEYVIGGGNVTIVDDTVFKEAATYGVECDPFIVGVGNSKLSEVYNDIFCPVVHRIDVTIVDSGEFGIADNNLTWSLFSDGILEINGEGEMPQYVIDLPPWYEYREDIKTVIIKDGVTNIGAAFYNHTSLKIVSIPESVKEIQYAAFSECSELRHTFKWTENMYELKLNGFVIPNSVTDLGGSAFYKCSSIKSIDIPNSVTSLGSSVFSGCENLISITIPESVTTIPYKAFYRCRNLESIIIPDSIVDIGLSAFTFTQCSYNNEELWYIGNWLIECNSSAENVVIRNGTIGIASGAFSDYIDDSGSITYRGCTSLKSVTIPDSVKYIGESAFRSCKILTSLTIPESVASIGGYAFFECKNLEYITIKNPRCEIYDDENTIANNYSGFNGIIYGYENSTAKTYAEKYGYSFESLGEAPDNIMGDVNKDGIFNVSDVVLLQKWILAVPDTHLANWKAADICEDGRLDVFDLCLMKRMLISMQTGN